MLTSGWIEHAPFAFWLMQAHRPGTLVELGTHSGYSYLVFCQAVQRLKLQTRCYAVDTWRGDEHSGYYDDDVYEKLRGYHDEQYSGFSRLMRLRFDEALPQFADGSIDLLHIDGRHFYDDVRRDFESWRPKLSRRSLVLFHDTQVRDREFGVFRLWEELRGHYRHFEFEHGNGLGVLATGWLLRRSVRRLLAASREASSAQAIRHAYARIAATLPPVEDAPQPAPPSAPAGEKVPAQTSV